MMGDLLFSKDKRPERCWRERARGHSNNKRHLKGGRTQQCHQMTHGRGRGSTKVWSDIFGLFLYKIAPQKALKKHCKSIEKALKKAIIF